MCKCCKYGRGRSDDRVCCDECYLNGKTHIVFYKDLYRKSDFLCEGCVEFCCDKKWQEMLRISKIVNIEKYSANNKVFCDKCELKEWNYIIIFKDKRKHFLCNVCSSFFINMKYKEMAA